MNFISAHCSVKSYVNGSLCIQAIADVLDSNHMCGAFASFWKVYLHSCTLLQFHSEFIHFLLYKVHCHQLYLPSKSSSCDNYFQILYSLFELHTHHQPNPENFNLTNLLYSSASISFKKPNFSMAFWVS